MNRPRFVRTLLSCGLLSTVLFGSLSGLSAAHAQSSYPDRPIRLVVPFSPGGGGDVQGRIVAAKLSERLGQPVVVENRGGAGGNIGTTVVARAAADGYTLLLATAATVINPSVWAKAGFDANRDLTAVAAWSTSPLLILANPAVPVADLNQLIALAKTQPGKLTFGSGGIGIITHVEMELLKYRTGIDLLHVAFPGQAGAVTAVVGGHVDLLSDSIASAMSFVKANRLKALAITSPKRSAALPDVPTVAEQGHPDLAHSAWYGVVAPANTPQAILDKLSDAIVATQKEAATHQQLADVGAEPFVADRATFARFLEQQGKTWAEVAKQAGIRVE